MIGFIYRYFQRQKEVAKLEAEQIVAANNIYYQKGINILINRTQCPRCGQPPDKSVIGSHEECMDIILDYCSDPCHYIKFWLKGVNCQYINSDLITRIGRNAK